MRHDRPTSSRCAGSSAPVWPHRTVRTAWRPLRAHRAQRSARSMRQGAFSCRRPLTAARRSAAHSVPWISGPSCWSCSYARSMSRARGPYAAHRRARAPRRGIRARSAAGSSLGRRRGRPIAARRASESRRAKAGRRARAREARRMRRGLARASQYRAVRGRARCPFGGRPPLPVRRWRRRRRKSRAKAGSCRGRAFEHRARTPRLQDARPRARTR